MLSILFFNLALQIKGGVLLYLPGYLLVLAKIRGILCPIFFFAFSTLFITGIAYPFIIVNADGYFNKIFGIGRRIGLDHTVLHQLIVDEKTFMSPTYPKIIIGVLLSLNVFFLIFKWTNIRTFFKDIRVFPLSIKHQTINPLDVIIITVSSAFFS
jgi:uncharacterized membrane protein